MHSRFSPIIAIVIIGILIGLGCSQGSSSGPQNPLAPTLSNPQDLARDTAVSKQHSLLGLYTCIVDPEKPGIETIPLRDTMFHLNALRFLEPPPPVRIVLSNFEYDGDTIDVDIQFVHPFGGYPNYTGFDVCGIVITSGSISGFSDPDLVVAGEGDTRLINPDGLTRWWNPREFPYNDEVPMWGYIDGNLGTPDETAQFTATLSGYKYHADGLSMYDDLIDLDTSTRGSFSAGSAHTRHYTIELDAELVFNYAIDACWLPPEGDPPVIIPDSFPESANRDEPWLIELNVAENTLNYDPSTGSGGGELLLDIDCYDWFDADQNTVRVECPGVFDPVTTDIPTGGGDTYSTYHVEITELDITSIEPITIWVSAEAGMDYDGWLPDKPTAAYLPPVDIDVELFEPQEPTLVLVWGDEGFIHHGSRIPYNDIEPALILNGEGNVLCSFSWWWENTPGHYVNCVRYSTSTDNGYTFSSAVMGGWNSHGGPVSLGHVYNNKYTLGSNGLAFQSYKCPAGHALGATPYFDPHEETRSHSGTLMSHAGEMMYTSEGYPMMFGDRTWDKDGVIVMQRGDYPNQGGTGTWPVYQGVYYTLVDEPTENWLSIARSEDKTSDGICHLIFWHGGLPYIKMISSTDISGISWTEPISVFEGLAEVWVGASDPSLWIDDNDGFHTLFAGELWWGEYELMYGYSENGTDWDEGTSFESIGTFPVEDGLNDTHVVVFDAFDYTWVFVCYETAGNVFCMYKDISQSDFSDPILVNEHAPAALPDIYPNGNLGAIFAYQADDGTGNDLTDIYYRVAEFEED